MDLENMAQRMSDSESMRDRMRAAAKETGELARQNGLEVLVLQPILNYDGITDPKEHADRLDDVVFRFELCKLLGTDMMQIPANFRLDDGITGDEQRIVKDLQELAVSLADPCTLSLYTEMLWSQDLGAKQTPPIRFVYEAMCWSTHNCTWQQGWKIVQLVDRENFGAVLDAFHIAGYEYADPTAEGSVRPDAKDRLDKSLKELTSAIPSEKIFYLQLADAERLDTPLVEGAGSPYFVKGQQPRMTWSRNCRLFPYEESRGAFMPIEQVCQAFVDTGFKGWVSLELFNRYMSQSDADIPQQHAQRGWKSWQQLKANLRL